MFKSKRVCPHCGFKKNAATASFCGECGHPLNEDERSAVVKDNIWKPREDEMAARIGLDDLKRSLGGHTLTVATGARALIYKQGQLSATVKAGQYTLDGLIGKIGRLGGDAKVEAVVCREPPLPLGFHMQGITCREYLELDVQLSFAVRVESPEMMVANLMGPGKNVIAEKELRNLLFPFIKQSLGEYFRPRSLTELDQHDGQLRLEVSRFLEQSLAAALSRYGLALEQVQTIAVGHTAYDENNQIVAQAWLDVDRERKQQEARKSLNELYREEELEQIKALRHRQTLQRLAREVEQDGDEDRYKEKLREIDLLERVCKADSREAAIHDELDETLKRLEHERQQRDGQRTEEAADWEILQREAQVQRDQRLSELEAISEHKLKRLQIDQEFEEKLLRQRKEIELTELTDSEENRRYRERLQREEAEAERIRASRRRQIDDELEEKGKRFQVEIGRREGEIELKKKKRAQQREHMMGMLEMDRILEEEKRKREEAEHRREKEIKEAEQAHEIERLKTLDQLGPETLIHLSSTEQGTIIAGLQRTRMLEGKSEEQILAMAAENSPHVAEALKERYRSGQERAMSDRERALYERMADKAEAGMETVRQMAAEQSRSLLESQRIMAETTRSFGGQEKVIIAGDRQTSDRSAHQVQDSPPSFRVLICTQCRAENPFGNKHCNNCGAVL